jgi:hypothetical protein
MKRLSSLLRPALAAALLALGSAQALAQEVLLAVDTRLNRVMTLDPFSGAVLNPNFITDAGPAGLYDFQTPRAAIQVNDQIWVTDQSPNVNAIFRFDLSGGYLGSIGGNQPDGGLSNLRGLRFIDGVVYAVNAGTTNGAPGASIVRIAPDGSILGSFSTLAAGGTIGASPWDVVAYGGQLLVSDGTSRALQLYNTDGTHAGAFTSAFNNIPQQMFVRANGNVLAAANGSQPLSSFGLYEFGSNGQVVTSWTGTPGLGVRGVYELGNGQYLISEGGGASTVRGLGTIDPAGAASNANFSLILGQVNGGWISPANLTPIPEPASLLLMAAGLAGLLAWRRASSRAPARPASR